MLSVSCTPVIVEEFIDEYRGQIQYMSRISKAKFLQFENVTKKKDDKVIISGLVNLEVCSRQSSGAPLLLKISRRYCRNGYTEQPLRFMHEVDVRESHEIATISSA